MADSDPQKRVPDRAEAEERDPEESVREAVEVSRSGAPAVGKVVRDRFSSDEVFQRILAAADEEITSGTRELFFSALAAGFAITITFMLLVTMTATTGGNPVLSVLLYPLGFIYIIIGGYQLYTENTLPPVALTLERLASIPALFRNWGVVLAGNFTGGALGAAALAFGGVLSPEAAAVAADVGQKGVKTGWWPLFSKAAFAGLIVAGVVWVEYAARDTISRLVVVYLAFLAIPLGGLYHSVVSFTEMTYLVLLGDLALFTGLTQFVLPVLLGNTIGGVVLVTVVNYFQTSEERLESARFDGGERQLSFGEWFYGGFVGKSYVPLVDTVEEAGEDDDSYRVVVPISNPRTETRTVEFACQLASSKENATVHIAHIVQKPEHASSGYGPNQNQQIIQESEALMEGFRETVQDYDIQCESSTIVSHRSFQEIFEVADRKNADLVVMGWGEKGLWGAARSDRRLSDLTTQLPCDFLVLKDRDLDTSRVLLPAKDAPNFDLSAEVARTLRTVAGSEITLLGVADGPDDREDAEQWLTDWAASHDLADATMRVDDSGDFEGAIARESDDHTLVVIGATDRGVLSRLVRGSLQLSAVEEVDSSVLLAERGAGRSFIGRLFGRQ